MREFTPVVSLCARVQQNSTGAVRVRVSPQKRDFPIFPHGLRARTVCPGGSGAVCPVRGKAAGGKCRSGRQYDLCRDKAALSTAPHLLQIGRRAQDRSQPVRGQHDHPGGHSAAQAVRVHAAVSVSRTAQHLLSIQPRLPSPRKSVLRAAGKRVRVHQRYGGGDRAPPLWKR